MGGARLLLVIGAALAAVAFLFRHSRLPIARLFGWLAAVLLGVEILVMLSLGAGDWVHGVRTLDVGELFSLTLFVGVVIAESVLVRWLLARR